MSSVFYRYNYELSYIDNATKVLTKCNIIDGDEEGLSFFFTSKNGNEFYKLVVKEIKNSMFVVKEKINTIETTKIISRSELLKIINSTENLKFVVDYINNKSDTKKSKGSSKASSVKTDKTSKTKSEKNTTSKDSKTKDIKTKDSKTKTDKPKKSSTTKH